MDYQAIFKRNELKYLLNRHQYDKIRKFLSSHTALDPYGLTTIRNVYYDTDSYLLIRRSMDKPIYKEKLRVRSYRTRQMDEPVFVELKKKYKGVVYKRRLSMIQEDAFSWLSGAQDKMPPSQIGRELEYFQNFYGGLQPTVFLSYDREALLCPDSDLRITFDTAIRYRTDGLSLDLPPDGIVLLPEDQVLMELKASGGLPLWLTGFLSRENIFKTSYSKYAHAYIHLKGVHSHV